MRTTLISRFIIFCIIAFIAMCMVLSSCNPEKRIARIYMRHPELKPIESDSIRTWISYVCDSFPVNIPYQELTFDNSGIIPESVNYHHTKRVGALTGSVDISKGKLTFKCAEDSLKEVIRFQKEIINQKDTRKEIITNTVYISGWWQTLYKWGFWILFGIWIVIAIDRFFLKGML